MALMKLGMTISPQKDLDGAVTTLRRALTDFQTLAAAEPGDARVLRRLAGTHMYIGRRLAVMGHVGEAVPSLREAIRITDGVIARNRKDWLAQNYSWRSSQELAKALAAQGQRNEALTFARKAIGAAEAARSADGANPVTQSFLPQAWSNAGEVYVALAAQGASPGAGPRGLARGSRFVPEKRRNVGKDTDWRRGPNRLGSPAGTRPGRGQTLRNGRSRSPLRAGRSAETRGRRHLRSRFSCFP